MKPIQSIHDEVRHYRRVRRSTPGRRLPMSRRSGYIILGVGAAILTAIAGYTVGALVIGSFSSSPPQSAAYGLPQAPPGVSFVSAEAQMVNLTTSPAVGGCTASNLGNLTSPTALVSGASTAICLSHSASGYDAADFMYTLQIQWNATAANATVFKVQVSLDVTPSANDLFVTAYVKTSATITSPESAVLAVDLTQSSDTSVTAYAVLVTQL